MQQYVSLLRAINVGGRNVIKMEALRSIYERLGYQNVHTYLQSGNVIFKTELIDKEIVSQSISKAIQDNYGYKVAVLTLDIDELKQILYNNPFQDQDQEQSVYITYLHDSPSIDNLEKIKEKLQDGEVYNLREKNFYLYCPKGYSKTKITNAYLEKELNTIGTTRNLKTSKALLELMKK